jgi:PhzF family phenazine biosynthesis protein
MGVTIYQVDAFSDVPFHGNPAAVCPLDGPADEAWMQHVAGEMNLSETAFLHPEGKGYRLRWFTPAVEVALCGHATLASAHVLYETRRLPPDATVVFHTLSGDLMARRQDRRIELDFPVTRAEPADLPAGVSDALGVEPLFVGKSRFDYLIEVRSAATVRSLKPDFTALKRLAVRGIMVTAAGDSPDCDFISRFFAPAVGIDEDPVTGSAHCCLAPYWAEKLGQDTFEAFQASARGGHLHLRLAGDRVIIGGQAVTVMTGTLAV